MMKKSIKSKAFEKSARDFVEGDCSKEVITIIKEEYRIRPEEDVFVDDMNISSNKVRLDWVKKLIKNMDKNINLLDAGSWTGAFANEIYNCGFNRITCLDITESVCKLGKKTYPHLDFIRSDVENYIPTEKYDVILACDLLEHLIDPIKTIDKMRNWLTDDGVVLVTVPDANRVKNTFLGGNFEHIHPIAENDMIKISAHIEKIKYYDDYYWYCAIITPRFSS